MNDYWMLMTYTDCSYKQRRLTARTREDAVREATYNVEQVARITKELTQQIGQPRREWTHVYVGSVPVGVVPERNTEFGELIKIELPKHP